MFLFELYWYFVKINVYSDSVRFQTDLITKDSPMDFSPLLGTSFDCSCGKRHHIPTRHIFYGVDALSHLAEIGASTSAGPKYLIIADTRTWKAAGEQALRQLEAVDCKVNTFIVPDNGDEGPTRNSAFTREPQLFIQPLYEES